MGRLRRALRWFGRQFVRLSVALAVLLIVAGGYFAWRLGTDRAEVFADPVAQFKYGSTGATGISASPT